MNHWRRDEPSTWTKCHAMAAAFLGDKDAMATAPAMGEGDDEDEDEDGNGAGGGGGGFQPGLSLTSRSRAAVSAGQYRAVQGAEIR